MKIYIADISPLCHQELFEKMLSFVSDDRKEKIKRSRKTLAQVQSLGAGLLLEYGLNQYGMTLIPKRQGLYTKIVSNQDGKPRVAEGNICFNLSHTGTYVAGIFAEEEVGIDIEQQKRSGQKIAERFFTVEENNYLDTVGTDQFTELWTRKESYVKAVGKGLRIPLRSFSVLEDTMKGEETFYLRTWKREGYSLSVCGKQPISTEPSEIEFDVMFGADPVF